MDRKQRNEYVKLINHIQSCESVTSDCVVSRLVIDRLNRKLNQPNGGGSTTRKLSFSVADASKKMTTKTKKKGVENGVWAALSGFLTCVRILLLDLPLTFLFISVITSYLIHQYYTLYVSPMVTAAKWDGVDRLRHEFTYYERKCDASDVSAHEISGLVLDSNNPDHNASKAVETFMTHGMSMMTDILDADVSDELRNYILRRNLELTDEEVIPLDTPEGRWSFGIDANEHPSVALALNQIGSHTLLHQTLEKLLGPDPAVAEITAITVAPGAQPQGWHPDVKPLGNSLKYAQTFTHSYSLFIPLQNVTKRMGATELCPGTHFCGEETLTDVCIQGGFQASKSNKPEDAWKVGDGLIMNQKMWHRGGAYYPSPKQENPYRVVFILTFISRPNFGLDHRQLSHGTYFHIHPFMYGHTFQDLKNAQISMSFPFSMFRSIGLWKPPKANWGWDWVTTSSLRIANGENGYHYEDLEDFVDFHKVAQYLPSFLHGSVNEQSGWQGYIEDTISRIHKFFAIFYSFVAVIYLLLFFGIGYVKGEYRGFKKAIVRTVSIHLIVLFAAQVATKKVQQTQLCQSVDRKTIFARPFLPEPISIQKQKLKLAAKTSMARKHNKSNTSVSFAFLEEDGPTTVPTKYDFLKGVRYDSKHIGYYTNFLDYHPGNKKMMHLIQSYQDLYQNYSNLPNTFQDQIVDSILFRIESDGNRFLRQNVYGEWLIMETKEEKMKEILKHLAYDAETSGKNLVLALDKAVSMLSSNAKFDTTIRTSKVMRRETLRVLSSWRDVLFKEIKFKVPMVGKTKMRLTSPGIKGERSIIYSPSFKLSSYPVHTKYITRKFGRVYNRSLINKFKYQVGDRILFNYQGSGNWVDGLIYHIEYEKYGYAQRSFDDGLTERAGIYLNKIKPYVPLQSGDTVTGIFRDCARCPSHFLPGTIMKVHNDYRYDVLYSTGELEYGALEDHLSRRYANDENTKS
mmetsp:Transcript_8819/g.10208  ORF Transcript_8819/g.10208 Transcript_8819/m.10208 type:complete len:967 (-) Transcript_8819:1064-3964(-)